MATGDLHKNISEDRSSGSKNMLTDRQTHRQTDRQSDRNPPLPYRSGVNMVLINVGVSVWSFYTVILLFCIV